MTLFVCENRQFNEKLFYTIGNLMILHRHYE